MAVHKVNNIIFNYNLKICENKRKVLAFVGKYLCRSKIVINSMILEQVSSCNYLGCNVSYKQDDINLKLNKFEHVCGTVRQSLRQKTRKEKRLHYHEVMGVPVLMYGSEN
jgi:hypothetical protein